MTTYIAFVLDETGSMQHLQDEAISGFNAYIEELRKKLKGRTNFSLLKFNSSKMDWFVKAASIKDVNELSHDTYMPNNSTPLWDAIGDAISELDERIKNKKNPKIILTVLTDGYENMSRRYTSEQVKALIEDRKEWGFSFVGAGIDAWHATSDIGISVDSATTTPSTTKGIQQGLRAVAASSAVFVSGQSKPDSMFDGAKTAEDYLKKKNK